VRGVRGVRGGQLNAADRLRSLPGDANASFLVVPASGRSQGMRIALG